MALTLGAEWEQRCGCRKCRQCWSGGMIVFVEESAESIVSADSQTCEGRGFGDRIGQRAQWSGDGDTSVRSVLIVVEFVLAQGGQQMCLVPDQGPAE